MNFFENIIKSAFGRVRKSKKARLGRNMPDSAPADNGILIYAVSALPGLKCDCFLARKLATSDEYRVCEQLASGITAADLKRKMAEAGMSGQKVFRIDGLGVGDLVSGGVVAISPSSVF